MIFQVFSEKTAYANKIQKLQDQFNYPAVYNFVINIYLTKNTPEQCLTEGHVDQLKLRVAKTTGQASKRNTLETGHNIQI